MSCSTHCTPSLSLRSLSCIQVFLKEKGCSENCLHHLSCGAWYNEYYTGNMSVCPKLCLFMWPHPYSQGLCPSPLISFLQDLDRCQIHGLWHNSDRDSWLLGKTIEFKSSVEIIRNALSLVIRLFPIQKKSIPNPLLETSAFWFGSGCLVLRVADEFTEDNSSLCLLHLVHGNVRRFLFSVDFSDIICKALVLWIVKIQPFQERNKKSAWQKILE